MTGGSNRSAAATCRSGMRWESDCSDADVVDNNLTVLKKFIAVDRWNPYLVAAAAATGVV